MRVFVFHGAGSRFANAIFSSLENAETWITLHEITGLLTEYDVDAPAFDRKLKEGKLPKYIRKSLMEGDTTTWYAERYVDGARHRHYFLGLGEDSPGFHEAADRWEREHRERNS
jgi:hypothetical protein